ncbi:exonuclease domain-containing protein [Niabella yanshanensis]|uniref:Exonuclease domain-containing protein n=1 Tax=Niabella yanshanensis TaxID=577386 RepID=A0ABZ0W6X4_9BACT|nr:exonuclease domain-containing protein [Niabella yanshanensis]WQD38881.1 exonuclease domain-containing protein [Niabella yanshanensis]
MEYAIVDIETTGGNAGLGSITEIAIRIFNGNQVIDSYETLVKPLHSIPPYVASLTGINDDMVANCLPFADIAKDVFTMLEGRTFVAHNVNFDYSFLKHHLGSAGYHYAAPKLCTIRMSRKIRPGLPSYSLGNLCDALDISIAGRHRAGGDADATALLFSKLLAWDLDGVIPAMLNEVAEEKQLPAALRNDFDGLPNTPGVYYFYNDSDEVIYIGKARDLKKRVGQHFAIHSPNRKGSKFAKKVARISYEACGTELMALILEVLEIKRVYPKYNTALKKYEAKAGLFVYEDENGYQRMTIAKAKKGYQPVQVFTTRQGGMNKLRELSRRYGLCASLCRLSSCELCDLVDKQKDLLCTANQAPDVYNQKVERALSFLKKDEQGFYIMDKGRHAGEKSCIWVENGQFYGMGYIDNDADIYSLNDVRDSLTRYPGDHYIMQLIISYVCKYPRKVAPITGKPVSAEWD